MTKSFWFQADNIEDFKRFCEIFCRNEDEIKEVTELRRKMKNRVRISQFSIFFSPYQVIFFLHKVCTSILFFICIKLNKVSSLRKSWIMNKSRKLRVGTLTSNILTNQIEGKWRHSKGKQKQKNSLVKILGVRELTLNSWKEIFWAIHTSQYRSQKNKIFF